MRNIIITTLVLMLLAVTGCEKVTVHPDLSNSLGYDAFDKMQTIDRKNASIALYVEPELLDAKTTQTIRLGDFEFEIGKAIAVKIIKGLTYQFSAVHIIKQPSPPSNLETDAVMRVELQDIDAQMSVKPGWNTVAAESYTRLAIRTEIRDWRENRVVWVGTSQVSQTETTREQARMSYQEAGRGFAAGFDAAIDKAIGDIFNQMARSQNLDKYFDSWEKQNAKLY